MTEFSYLSRFRGGSLPYNLSSLISLRKVINFQIFHLFFSYYKNEADNFQAFYKIEGKTTSLFTKAHQRLSLKRWIIGSSYEDVRKWEFLYSTEVLQIPVSFI